MIINSDVIVTKVLWNIKQKDYLDGDGGISLSNIFGPEGGEQRRRLLLEEGGDDRWRGGQVEQVGVGGDLVEDIQQGALQLLACIVMVPDVLHGLLRSAQGSKILDHQVHI